MSTATVPVSSQALDPIAAARVLENAVTRSGEKLMSLSASVPVLLVFLRHAGCTFCRETLSDLARNRTEIEAGGTRIVVVHMGDSVGIDELLLRFGLSGLDRILDTEQELYRTFGLKRGTLRQLFGLKVFHRAILGGALMKHGIGRLAADGSQMPGLFLLYQGSIVRRFRHRSAADRPDYLALCSSPAEVVSS